MDNNNFDIKNEVKQENNGGSQEQGMKRSYNDMGNDKDDMPQKRFRRGGNDHRNNDGRWAQVKYLLKIDCFLQN